MNIYKRLPSYLRSGARGVVSFAKSWVDRGRRKYRCGSLSNKCITITNNDLEQIPSLLKTCRLFSPVCSNFHLWMIISSMGIFRRVKFRYDDI